jgi:hypothetical protein
MMSSLRALPVCLLLSSIAVSDGLAGEWEDLRETYDNALKAQARRIAEIEARERGTPAEKRAEKITRDRLASMESSPRGGRAKSLIDAAQKASGNARVLADLTREQGEYLDAAASEWRADGPERRKLRESSGIVQKNLDLATAILARTIEIAGTTGTWLPQSGVLEKVARMEAEAKARASWQREQAARDRERQQREREAAERERGVR